MSNAPTAETNPNLGYSPPTPAPGPGGALPPEKQQQLARLQVALDRFEITIAEADELVVLEDYDIMLIADDSGSMQNSSMPGHMRGLGAMNRSRWDELKETVASIVDIGSTFSPLGIDIYFLNRPPARQVRSSTDTAFQTAFQDPPRGGTPLTETIRRMMADMGRRERKTLLFVLTDGEPSGGKAPCIAALRDISSGGKTRVQVMVCTPEDDEVEWLNDLDHQLTTVDVTDDYFNEKKEVMQAGLAAKFTRGDWVMKAMLGPISKKFDAWDERVGKSRHGSPECSLCSIM